MSKSADLRTTKQPSLKNIALRLLGQREHTRVELERKLARFEPEPGALAHLLDEMQTQGWLNEERAAQSLVHRRAAAHGLRRLRQEMQDKGLAHGLIEQTLAGLADSELARARAVWERRYKRQQPLSTAEHAKQARFLLNRGFSAEVVRHVLGPDWAEEAF